MFHQSTKHFASLSSNRIPIDHALIFLLAVLCRLLSGNHFHVEHLLGNRLGILFLRNFVPFVPVTRGFEFGSCYFSLFFGCCTNSCCNSNSSVSVIAGGQLREHICISYSINGNVDSVLDYSVSKEGPITAEKIG